MCLSPTITLHCTDYHPCLVHRTIPCPTIRTIIYLLWPFNSAKQTMHARPSPTLLAKLSDVVVDRSDLLLNVCASTSLVAMDKIQVQTPKGRCEKLQSVDPARRGRSNVSLIYLLQRPRVSPNYVRGALVKLSTKKNRFPHTFSKAPCSGMQLFRTSRGRVQPPLSEKKARAQLAVRRAAAKEDGHEEGRVHQGSRRTGLEARAPFCKPIHTVSSFFFPSCTSYCRTNV